MEASIPRIRVLPSQLADQIAAGEVVERPASVVKELVENSLDAGARRVDIDIEGGGRRLIRVVDDGGGMTPDEARLSLQRHATSKLGAIEDLFALVTMGFRGEALPSIAAVSRFAVTTRMAAQDAAFRIDVEAGVEKDAAACGAPVGTQVEVRDLLWNLPARLKFLKAEATEAAHITEAVARLALAHPGVHFRLRHGGRVALDLPPVSDAAERVRAVLGRRLGARLVVSSHDESGVRIDVLLAPPEEAQTTSRGLHLYVGRRYVKDRGLMHAVLMGYGELVPRGRYPTAVAFVEPPLGTVDVNVHPQKTEVRFARPQDVYAAMRHGVAQAVARAPWLAEPPDVSPAARSVMAVASVMPPAPLVVSDVAAAYGDYQERLLLGGFQPMPGPRPAPLATPAPPLAPAPTPGERTTGGFFSSLQYLGQLDLTYLVCEGAGELVLIDQHAAHERIAFQRLRDAYTGGHARTQRLLFPQNVELSETQAAAASEHAAALAPLGFELEPFGGARWALRAAPADLPEAEVTTTLLELLDDLADTDASRAVNERIDHIFATIACHSVVRAGDVLSTHEARALLEAMDGVDYRVHCPHGRPVLLRIGVAEIARRFGRT
jgi:DNA mismatch repair protein MutL